jgi:hypothetical protein
MEPLVLQLIKQVPESEGDTLYFLNAVTNFCLSIYSEDGFEGPGIDSVTDELVLTLFVDVNTDPPRVRAHTPVVHLIPLGETNPLEAAGSYMVVRVVDQYDVEYCRARFGGDTITQHIPPDMTERPWPDASFGSNGSNSTQLREGNVSPLKNPC